MRADRLRELRQKHGLSQEGLAVQIGVRGQQIWRYENGSQLPNADVVARLAIALGTSADYLLGLADNPSPMKASEELSHQEKQALAAWRRGDRLEAIRLIASSTSKGG